MNKRYRDLRSYGHSKPIAFMGSIPLWLPVAIGAIVGWFIL